MEAAQEMPPESRLGRLLGRFSAFAEAMETQPIDTLERHVADIERRLALIETRLGAPARDTAKEI